MNLKIIKILTLFSIFALCSCSALQFKQEGTPEAKITVARVTNAYLSNIIAGKNRQVRKMIDWTVFFDGDDDNVTIGGIDRQIVELNKLHTFENHPLTNLSIKDIQVWDNDGEVVLVKKGDQDNPIINVELHWYGSGWMIKKDNLFGKNGIITKAIEVAKK